MDKNLRGVGLAVCVGLRVCGHKAIKSVADYWAKYGADKP